MATVNYKTPKFSPVVLIIESIEELQTLYLKLLPSFEHMKDLPAGENPETEAGRNLWDFGKIKKSDADYRLWKLVSEAIRAVGNK